MVAPGVVVVVLVSIRPGQWSVANEIGCEQQQVSEQNASNWRAALSST